MFAKIAVKALPWLLVVILALLFWFIKIPDGVFNREPATLVANSTTILDKVEDLGRLELVKYSFREITELKQRGERLNFYLGSLPLGGDAEIVLFTSGEAVGCVDLTKMSASDILEEGDTVFVSLPPPELCYFKIDLQNTRVYNYEASSYINEGAFLDSAYRLAERQIRDAALESDILDQTFNNAELILKPLLEATSGKTIIIRRRPRQLQISRPD